MNIQHLKIIANQLQFNLTAEPAQQIPGGPGGGHLCWEVKFDKGTFFIKQLDPAIDVNNKKNIARYELCESIAFRFAQLDIPAVHAIKNDDKYVIVLENIAYLVFPWIEGYMQHGSQTSEKHSVKIAEILAKIHSINLKVPEVEVKLDIHTNEKIVASIERAISCGISASTDLIKNQNMILSMNEHYLSVTPILKEKTVITHGDVFPHNVIWQEPDQPFLIDWEAVKNMNPSREAIRACLAWSGFGTDLFSLPLCMRMLQTYINFGGPLEKNHIDAALSAGYGNVIFWLLYNIELACSADTSDKKDAAINEINRSLVVGSKLIELYPRLLNSITHLFPN